MRSIVPYKGHPCASIESLRLLPQKCLGACINTYFVSVIPTYVRTIYRHSKTTAVYQKYYCNIAHRVSKTCTPKVQWYLYYYNQYLKKNSLRDIRMFSVTNYGVG